MFATNNPGCNDPNLLAASQICEQCNLAEVPAGENSPRGEDSPMYGPEAPVSPTITPPSSVHEVVGMKEDAGTGENANRPAAADTSEGELERKRIRQQAGELQASSSTILDRHRGTHESDTDISVGQSDGYDNDGSYGERSNDALPGTDSSKLQNGGSKKDG